MASAATEGTPWVARGYLNDWPVVQHAEQGSENALSYLAGFYQGRPVSAFLAEPETKGRFFTRLAHVSVTGEQKRKERSFTHEAST